VSTNGYGVAVSRPPRTRASSIGQRVVYRLDRFLDQPPWLQLAAILALALIVVIAFGGLRTLAEGDPSDRTFGAGLWWAVTRLLDGGTVAGDAGLLSRAFGLLVTLLGLVAVAVLTGAFASSFVERIAALRRGTNAVFENGHVVLLGFNARGSVVLRELGVSGMRATVVILTQEDRDRVEERVQHAFGGREHRLRIVVRHGDPTTQAVRRAALRSAAAILILPEADPGPLADRAALRSVLAARRALHGRRVAFIVEVSSSEGREVVELAAHGEEIAVVEGRDVNARLLAHASRQPGAYETMRQLLSLDARSFFAEPADELAGETFTQAVGRIEGGVLVGLARDGRVELCPRGSTRIEAKDELVVFRDSDRSLTKGRSWDEPMTTVAAADLTEPLRVAVTRYSSELALVLSFIEARRPVEVTILVAPHEADLVRSALAQAPLRRTTARFVEGDAVDGATISELVRSACDVVLVLAPDAIRRDAIDADVDQIVSLLHLRRALSLRPAPRPRVVVELRGAETKALVSELAADDLVLSRELTSMLLAQELHVAFERTSARWQSSIYREVLHADTVELRLRPIYPYLKDGVSATFASVARAAQALDEVAIGVIEEGSKPRLVPDGQHRIERSEQARVIVLSRTDARASDERGEVPSLDPCPSQA